MVEKENCGHVLFLPYPNQGHINPMLQFAKRLTSYHLRCTLAVTRFILSSTHPTPGPVHLAPISDGFDRVGFSGAESIEAYLTGLESAGSETLDALLRSESAASRPVQVVVYDAFLPWAQPVARRRGAAAVAFFTQSCAVDAIYSQVWEGKVKVPVESGPVELTGLPPLEPGDFPSFLPGPGVYAAYLVRVLEQFKGLETADEVFMNSFYELEPEEAKYMSSTWRAKTVGPTVPSFYLDNRLPSDDAYGFHLFTPTTIPCISWLDSKPPHSVVYVSFGSMTVPPPAQISELAHGLLNSNKTFLWVVRSSEASKLPEDFLEKSKERGIVISWSPQLEVLAHEAVGCFFTHCGWNSTMEGIALGVPMVAMPGWTDQPTNAKYVEGVWGVGVRVKAECGGGGEGLVRREEVERCVREVMEGERSGEYRRRAKEWGEKAKAAVGEGGSSDRNIIEFVAKYGSK
ncbi:UDP-glycosyltransferase 79-like [Typha angustifolia]|uniref:UDP-glycosyltransferase 79-like n=1 Tax=Typha angustifolia TaxID=59011 RepID=UPI003C3067BE